MPQVPKPQLVREREGDLGKGRTHQKSNPLHPNALPEKPTYLSPEAGEFWDDYMRFSAPGLLKLVHKPALAQLCEDRAQERKLRLAITTKEEYIARQASKAMEKAQADGAEVDIRDSLPSGTLGAIAEDEEGFRLLRALNITALRIQKLEQQFGLTPQSATKVDLTDPGDGRDSFEDDLCA